MTQLWLCGQANFCQIWLQPHNLRNDGHNTRNFYEAEEGGRLEEPQKGEPPIIEKNFNV